MQIRILIYFLITIIITAGCQNKRTHPVNFYYWKADVDETTFLNFFIYICMYIFNTNSMIQ